MSQFLASLVVVTLFAGVFCVPEAKLTPNWPFPLFPIPLPPPSTSTFKLPTPPPLQFPQIIHLPDFHFATNDEDGRAGLAGGAHFGLGNEQHNQQQQLGQFPEHGMNHLETPEEQPGLILTITTIISDDEDQHVSSPVAAPKAPPPPPPPTLPPSPFYRRRPVATSPTTPKPNTDSITESNAFAQFFKLFEYETPRPSKAVKPPTARAPATPVWFENPHNPQNAKSHRVHAPMSSMSRSASAPAPEATTPVYVPGFGPESFSLPIESPAPRASVLQQKQEKLQSQMEKLFEYQADVVTLLESSVQLNALTALRLNKYVSKLNESPAPAPAIMARPPPRRPAPGPAPAPRAPRPSKLSPFTSFKDTASPTSPANGNEPHTHTDPNSKSYSNELVASVTSLIDSIPSAGEFFISL